MKQINMNIRPQFLPNIRNGKKKHEYRLASPKYKNLHVGDVICLVNNQEPNDFVKVIINKITKFNNWDDAFNGRWKDDFDDIFSDYDELINECYKFYSESEIEKYGIEVFEIKLIENKSVKKARFLFDTSVIIQKENRINANDIIGIMFNEINKIQGKLFYHPMAKEELEKNEDDKVKDLLLTKLNEYEELMITNKNIDQNFIDVCNKYSLNDVNKLDNEILLCVFNGNVDYLITEDIAILKTAKDLYIRDCVLTPNEILVLIKEQFPELINYNVLSVKLTRIGDLNYNDEFFDSLREDYGRSNFNGWLEKKSNEKAYIFQNNDGLQGFLYLKTEDENEDYSFIDPIFSKKKRLKIGTFKINSTGLRLGERFLKIIFDNALLKDVDEIYVTMFEDKRNEVTNLRNLMLDWGFIKYGRSNKTGEIVLVKNMKKYNYEKSPKYNFPLTDINNGIGILPIVAQYHTKLFPDLHLKNEDMILFNDSACSYAIEKIYISGSQNIIHKPGTILCVYRMADYNKIYRSVISGLVVLSEIKYIKSFEELIKECKNRSVFSEDELRNCYYNKNYRTIIKVLFLKAFDNKINLHDLYKRKIINDSGPTIRCIMNKEKYIELLKMGLNKL